MGKRYINSRGRAPTSLSTWGGPLRSAAPPDLRGPAYVRLPPDLRGPAYVQLSRAAVDPQTDMQVVDRQRTLEHQAAAIDACLQGGGMRGVAFLDFERRQLGRG